MSCDPILRITNGTSVPGTINHIPNPGFYDGTTGWTNGGRYAGDTAAILTVSNERSVFGRQSMFMWAANTAPLLGWVEITGLTPGETYTASVYVYVPLESGGDMVFGLVNGGGWGLGGIITIQTIRNPNWERLSISLVCPSNGSFRIYIGTGNPAGGPTIYFADGFQLEKGPVATPYCDGYQRRCAWLGDANASSSERKDFTGTTIDLLSDDRDAAGFFLSNWTPQVAQYKDGGIEASSPFADGTRLRHKQFNSVIETFDLRARNIGSDEMARQMAKLRQAMERASDYWVEPHNTTPWWIEARSTGETNSRYAYIQQGTIAEDTAPYSQPFLQRGGVRVTDELSLVVKRGHWLSHPPIESENLTLCSQATYQTGYALDFEADNNTDNVACGSDASIDNLPQSANGTTWEAWIKVESVGDGVGADTGRIFDKVQTIVITSTNGSLYVQTSAATTSALSTTTGIDLRDGRWHHVALTYDNGSDRRWDIYIDGVETSYAEHRAAVGALTSDAANNLTLGNAGGGIRAFDGQMSWVRLSDTIRYTASFVPPDRCFPPAIDANTAAQYNFREGTGGTLSDATGNNDGTITGADWVDGCESCTGNRLDVPTVYALDYDGTDFSVIDDSDSSHVGIQDLPVSGFCAEAWVKYSGIVSGDATGRIFDRGASGGDVRWAFYINNTHVDGRLGLTIQTTGTYASAESIESIDDGKWHHVAMQYDGVASGVSGIWIDGVQVTYYSRVQSTGTYNTDVPNDLFFGNDNVAGRGFVGQIAWIRISNITRFDYSGFTPFALCHPPNQDDQTVVLYYADEGAGNMLIDRSLYDDNAAIVGAEWADNCANLGDEAAPCACDDGYEYTPAVVTGFHKLAGLTNIHKSPTPPVAVRQTNLLGEQLPYHLLPDNVSDTQLYIGIDASLFGAGNEAVFNNVVFFLTVPYTGTVTWEYYDAVGAAWTAMTAFITGDVNLDKEGLNIICWPQPAGMTSAASVIGLPDGVYIRATFTAANEADVLQDKQQVYTASQPYLDIVEDFGGDISEIIGMTFVGNGSRTVKTAIRTVIAGARDLSRGENFQMILPFGDSQLPDNVSTTVSGGGLMGFSATVASPTYTCAVFTPASAADEGTATIQVDPPLSGEYTGRFVPVMRFWIDENSARSSAIQSYTLEVKIGTTSSDPIYSKTVTPSSYQVSSGPFVQDRHVVWPEIFLDPRAFRNALSILFEVTVTQVTAAVSDVYLTDFALIPADELIFEWGSSRFVASVEVLENDDFGDVSSIEFQNFGTLARANNQNWYAYIPRYNGPADLALGRGKRLWFWINSDDTNAVNGGYGIFGVLSTTYMRRVKRYLSLRGDL